MPLCGWNALDKLHTPPMCMTYIHLQFVWHAYSICVCERHVFRWCIGGSSHWNTPRMWGDTRGWCSLERSHSLEEAAERDRATKDREREREKPNQGRWRKGKVPASGTSGKTLIKLDPLVSTPSLSPLVPFNSWFKAQLGEPSLQIWMRSFFSSWPEAGT